MRALLCLLFRADRGALLACAATANIVLVAARALISDGAHSLRIERTLLNRLAFFACWDDDSAASRRFPSGFFGAKVPTPSEHNAQGNLACDGRNIYLNIKASTPNRSNSSTEHSRY